VEVDDEEACGNEKMALCIICIGSVSVFDRSLFDGVGRANLGREPYWHCDGDRDSRNRHNSAREEESLMDLTQLIPVGAIAAIVVLVGVVVVWKMVRDRKSGYPIQDERTQKINGKAALYSLLIGVYFMLGLLWVLLIGEMLLDYAVLDAMPALIMSSLVFSLSFIGLRWYLSRKGDL